MGWLVLRFRLEWLINKPFFRAYQTINARASQYNQGQGEKNIFSLWGGTRAYADARVRCGVRCAPDEADFLFLCLAVGGGRGWMRTRISSINLAPRRLWVTMEHTAGGPF
jgi:hypothetical protein